MLWSIKVVIVEYDYNLQYLFKIYANTQPTYYKMKNNILRFIKPSPFIESKNAKNENEVPSAALNFSDN